MFTERQEANVDSFFLAVDSIASDNLDLFLIWCSLDAIKVQLSPSDEKTRGYHDCRNSRIRGDIKPLTIKPFIRQTVMGARFNIQSHGIRTGQEKEKPQSVAVGNLKSMESSHWIFRAADLQRPGGRTNHVDTCFFVHICFWRRHWAWSLPPMCACGIQFDIQLFRFNKGSVIIIWQTL